jgi:WhiB family redox-sensing transcriptional regulator
MTDWRDRARCVNTDPESFFPESGETSPTAIKVCRGCPVSKQCLDFAMTKDIPFGIWGGLTQRQRLRLIRRAA